LSDDSMGWPPGLEPDAWPPCDSERDGGFGTDDETVGLNVTVRCGFGLAGTCCRLECSDEIRGVVSVELDAIVTDPAMSVCCDCNSLPPHCAKATTCHNGDCRDSARPSVEARKWVLMGAELSIACGGVLCMTSGPKARAVPTW
jgi:hypothetical protein